MFWVTKGLKPLNRFRRVLCKLDLIFKTRDLYKKSLSKIKRIKINNWNFLITIITISFQIGYFYHSNVSYFQIDDSEQPAKAKNIPQKHAQFLTEGTADFLSDTKPTVEEIYLRLVLATELESIASIDSSACKV